MVKKEDIKEYCPCDDCENKKSCMDDKLACETFLFYTACEDFSGKLFEPRRDIYELIYK